MLSGIQQNTLMDNVPSPRKLLLRSHCSSRVVGCALRGLDPARADLVARHAHRSGLGAADVLAQRLDPTPRSSKWAPLRFPHRGVPCSPTPVSGWSPLTMARLLAQCRRPAGRPRRCQVLWGRLGLAVEVVGDPRRDLVTVDDRSGSER